MTAAPVPWRPSGSAFRLIHALVRGSYASLLVNVPPARSPPIARMRSRYSTTAIPLRCEGIGVPDVQRFVFGS